MLINQHLKVFKRGQLDSTSAVLPNPNSKLSDSDTSFSSISVNNSFASYEKPVEVKKQFKFGKIAPPPVDVPIKVPEKTQRFSIAVSDDSDEDEKFDDIRARIAKRLGGCVNNFIKTEGAQKAKIKPDGLNKDKAKVDKTGTSKSNATSVFNLFDKSKKPVFLHAKKPSSESDSSFSSAFNTTEDKLKTPEPPKLPTEAIKLTESPRLTKPAEAPKLTKLTEATQFQIKPVKVPIQVKSSKESTQSVSNQSSAQIDKKAIRKTEIDKLKEEVSKLKSKLVFPNQVLIPGMDPPQPLAKLVENYKSSSASDSSFSSSSDEFLPKNKQPNIRKQTNNTENSFSSSVFNSGGEIDSSIGDKMKNAQNVSESLSNVSEESEHSDTKSSKKEVRYGQKKPNEKDKKFGNLLKVKPKKEIEKSPAKNTDKKESPNILSFLKSQVTQKASEKGTPQSKVKKHSSSSEEITESFSVISSEEEEVKQPKQKKTPFPKNTVKQILSPSIKPVLRIPEIINTKPIIKQNLISPKATNKPEIKETPDSSSSSEPSSSSDSSSHSKENKRRFQTENHEQRERIKSVKFDLNSVNVKTYRTEPTGSILVNKLEPAFILKKAHKIKLMTRVEEEVEDLKSKYSIDIYAFPTADQLPKAPSRRLVNTVYPSMNLGTRRGSNSLLIFADTAELPIAIRSKCQRVATIKKDEVTTAPRLSRPVTTSDLEKMAKLLAKYILSSTR